MLRATLWGQQRRLERGCWGKQGCQGPKPGPPPLSTWTPASACQTGLLASVPWQAFTPGYLQVKLASP